MASKEVMITAPLMVVLYDRAFRVDSWRRLFADRARTKFYAALAATSLIVIVYVAAGARSDSVGVKHGITWYQYFYTQAWAVAHYLRPLFVPLGLVFDYGTTTVRDWRALPGLLVLGALMVGTLCAWTKPRWRWIGFLGAWFFLLLAPSSSLVPIATEVAAERRVYLASAAVAVIVGIGIVWLAQRVSRRVVYGFAVLLMLALGCATYARGIVYRSTERLYRDLTAKKPDNPRAFVGLGLAILQSDSGRVAEAIPLFRLATSVDSTNFVAWRTLGVVELMRGNARAAVPALQRALALQPDNAELNDALARAHLAMGDAERAIPYIGRTGARDPDLLYSVGSVLVEQHRDAEAIPFIERAAGISLQPRGIALLSLAYAQAGRAADAAAAAREATRNAAGDATAYDYAARAMVTAGNRAQARAYAVQLQKLDSSSATARSILR